MEIINEGPRRALAVTPHPDDCEGGCGGTLSKWIHESGTEAVVVLCTNGDKGPSDRDMTPVVVAATREREQQAASDAMGAANVVFLSYPDGGLEDTILFRSQVVRAIRMYKPDIIMAIDPYRSISHTHRDHRMSGQVAVDSAFTYAWNERHFPEQITKEGLEPHRVTEVYLWGSEVPNVFVDVSEYLQMKADSLTKHASQMRGPVEGRLERVTNGARRSGERAGIPYAEGFRRIRFEIGSRDWQYLSC